MIQGFWGGVCPYSNRKEFTSTPPDYIPIAQHLKARIIVATTYSLFALGAMCDNFKSPLFISSLEAALQAVLDGQTRQPAPDQHEFALAALVLAEHLGHLEHVAHALQHGHSAGGGAHAAFEAVDGEGWRVGVERQGRFPEEGAQPGVQARELEGRERRERDGYGGDGRFLNVSRRMM